MSIGGRAMLGCFRRAGGLAIAASVGLLVAAYALPASANTVTFDLDTLFAGTTPAGAAPWVTVSFTDVKKNHVRVTLNAAGLKGHEFLAKDALLFELAMLP